MAPGRKRGAKGVGGPGGGGGLRLGDLVLAKVKGFPAWPAKVENKIHFNFFTFDFFSRLRFQFLLSYDD